MSNDMRWKSLASSASSRLKTYVVQKDPRALAAGSDSRQTWKEWAGERINSKRGPATPGVEKIAVFPGWAARKYLSGTGKPEEPFEIDVYISGYASAHRSPEFASRSQRAFLNLAKRFAALPKLEGDSETDYPGGPSKSTEDLLKSIQLPARPEDMTEEFEIEALEKQFRKLNNDSPDDSRQPSPEPPARTPVLPSSLNQISADIRKLHANLESRIQPFWSSVLPSRTIFIELFPKPINGTQDHQNYGPIAASHINTAPDGSFQARFTIKWEDLCQHPDGLHIAFGQGNDEAEFLAYLRLLPPPTPPNSLPLAPPPPLVATTARLALTNSPIRVVSDIDDTVKRSDVLGGARNVFHNVFVKELSELIIPGMGDWYTRMWNQGVRFHYISNGPFELLPVLGDFLHVAHLPPGSMKLRSYAGRSLFSGLLSAPAVRKRANVKDVLDAFPHSRFILIGDTGEQDMELYAEFAHQRPEQILAVFIRLADSTPVDDPTGRNAAQEMPLHSAPPTYGSFDSQSRVSRRTPSTSSSYSYTPRTPTHAKSHSDYFGAPITAEPDSMPDQGQYFTPTPTPTTSNTRMSSTSSTSSSRMTEEQKKKYELQTRVWAARMLIPAQIPFRVFKEPKECGVEAERVLKEAQSNIISEEETLKAKDLIDF